MTFSNLLLYADDTKIFRVIRRHEDCLLLQKDLLSFESYCSKNNLFLNISKCHTISFTRKKNLITYNYNLCGHVVSRVDKIRDLGVIVDCKLSFIPHIDTILEKSYKQLGFILRTCKPFQNPFTYKTLYNSYVRSRLEFACAVWMPFYRIHVDRIERIQRKFVRSLEYRTGQIYSEYEESAIRNGIQLLSDRRECVDALLLFKILHCICEAPSLLNKINLRVPRRRERQCCSKELFYVPKSRTCYAENTFIGRACRLYDRSPKLKEIDIFNSSVGIIKNTYKTKNNN